MKILLSGSLFIMGLLGSTKWFELNPDTAESPTSNMSCCARCNAVDNHYIVNYKLVIIVEEHCYVTIEANRIVIEEKEFGALCKGDSLFVSLFKTVENNMDTGLSGKQANNQAILVLVSSQCNPGIELPKKLLIPLK